MADEKPGPLGSADPRMPPPLPPAPPKLWAPREGILGDGKFRNYKSRFEEIVQVTPDVRLFRLTLDTYKETFPFIAGQFIQFLCPVPDKDKPGQTKRTIRSYSIASPPEEKRFIEFCIKLVLGGEFTPTLWDMREGDVIDMRGPVGKFVCEEPVKHDLVFIASGTGIAPFWSMIYHLLKTGVERRIVLIFGVRYEEDIVYEENFKMLAREHSNFTPIFTLSRPRNPATWWGRTGYVQNFLPELVKNPKNTRAFICGLTPMIEAAQATLEKLGMPREHIHYERYD